jgi:hypothetical protein
MGTCDIRRGLKELPYAGESNNTMCDGKEDRGISNFLNHFTSAVGRRDRMHRRGYPRIESLRLTAGSTEVEKVAISTNSIRG